MFGIQSKSKKFICSNCGVQGKGKDNTSGSLAVEIILWFFFILPGLIYSIWRLSTRKKVCSECGQDALIPIDTPRGKKLLADQGITE